MLVAVLLFVGTPMVLLALPLVVDVRASNQPTESSRVLIIGLFGFVRWRAVESVEPFSDSGDSRPRNQGRESQRLVVLLRRARVRARLWRFVRDIWRSIDKDDVQANMRLGLDDPADTGKLWAVIGPLGALMPRRRNLDLNLEPDFSREVFVWQIAGRLRFVPIRLLWLTGMLLLSPTLWRYLLDDLRTSPVR